MTSQTAYSILKLMSIKGLGPVNTNNILQALQHSDLDLSQLKAPEESHFLNQWISLSQLHELFKEDVELREKLSKLEEIKAKFINITENTYPQILLNTLKKSAPPLLTYLGNLNLLNKISVGFCGSRKASSKGLKVAEDCTEQLSKEEIVIVSGYAAGIDQITHYTALKSGGSTIIVLPESILNFRIRKNLKDVWDWDRVLVISEFLPNAIWTTARAMQRNKTIIGLSKAMILIEAGKRGGSMDAGKKALEMNKKLYAPVYDGMPPTAEGNRILLSQGAIQLMKNRTTGRANLSTLLTDLRNESLDNNTSSAETGSQLDLL